MHVFKKIFKEMFYWLSFFGIHIQEGLAEVILFLHNLFSFTCVCDFALLTTVQGRAEDRYRK